MQNLNIRAATADDLPRLADLWYDKTVLQQQTDARIVVAPDGRERWLRAAAAWLDDSQSAVRVVEAGEQVVGYIAGQITANDPGLLPERVGAVMDIAIDLHGYHGGAGRQLVSALCAWFGAHGVQQMSIHVPRSSAVEQAFWRALGANAWINKFWMTF